MENYIVMFVKLIKMFQNFIKERNQGYSRECKDCEKERKKIKRATQEINDRDRFLSRLLSGCKTRALKNNIPFDLTKEQLIELFEKQNGKCALSNLEMQTVIKAGKCFYR